MKLTPEPLSGESFAPFGEVIEAAGHEHFMINDGSCRRYHDLARLDLLEEGGRPCLSIFRARPQALPLRLRMLERHPLSSQAFVALGAARFLAIVAPPGPTPDRRNLKVFVCGPGQGVNYGPGVWHHPLVALDVESEFLILDRDGPGDNCEEFFFPAEQAITVEL